MKKVQVYSCYYKDGRAEDYREDLLEVIEIGDDEEFTTEDYIHEMICNGQPEEQWEGKWVKFEEIED